MNHGIKYLSESKSNHQNHATNNRWLLVKTCRGTTSPNCTILLCLQRLTLKLSKSTFQAVLGQSARGRIIQQPGSVSTKPAFNRHAPQSAGLCRHLVHPARLLLEDLICHDGSSRAQPPRHVLQGLHRTASYRQTPDRPWPRTLQQFLPRLLPREFPEYVLQDASAYEELRLRPAAQAHRHSFYSFRPRTYP